MHVEAPAEPLIEDAPGVASASEFPIVLFTNSFLIGGMEEHVLQLTRGLRQRGFQVAVLCSSTESIQALRDALAAAGAEVHTLQDRGRGPIGAAARLMALIRALQGYPHCVLHLHLTGHRGGDLAAVAGRRAGARAILRTMHLPPTDGAGLAGRAVQRLRDQLLDQIICASDQNRQAHEQLLGRDPRKCRLIHHGVDLRRFRPAQPSDELRAELGLARTDTLIGTVSRLSEKRKGMADFLDMARSVAGLRPDARFLVVGDGELRPELERYAVELGLAGRVLFTGERPDIPQILAQIRIFVMPSHYEAGPYTLLEAMATGCPVVSTPTGVAPEVIEHGQSGFLVPIGDAHALSSAVLELLTDDRLARRIGERGREQVERSHSMAAMLDAIIAAYRGIG